MTRVEHLVERFGRPKRTLQRLFREQRWGQPQVGHPPLSVLHEAARRLEAAEAELQLAQLAQDLGYADQAHLTRDFRSLVGLTPGAYVRG